ncbi:MAG: hypothetical protein O2888_02210 [Chloroflexi bacterium]|nr:hypothetical protein [Chloroflexota bacterium]
MTDTRTPRPTDLVALVTFGEDVRENMAVTRDHLGVPYESPRPIAAAIEQWLHLGRRTWISVSGREIRGIATARELASRTAWEIDTLVDAPDADDDVVVDLLRQAARAARDAQVTHLLLRTPLDSVAALVAPRAGFRRVVDERLWVGHLAAGEPSDRIRGARPEDDHARFQVFSRAYPVTAREALAMTQDEWRSVQDERWVERGGMILVEEPAGRVHAVAEVSPRGQFRLTVESGASECGTVLLGDLGRRLAVTPDHFALVPQESAAEDAVRAAGLVAAGEFALFCQRMARPAREDARARAGIAVTG